ncbi:hypothetical protein NP493_238g03014 [Ridgeia piscesae]|uniref:VWFA domain-containing protein n=1 Tax=Ridgeia piscesae TaxID=27915 RepID=A0AAD9UDK7_RIDPI|nr:hypothetical protein NP493_238g03014 [Ridgeia piscesae]
MFRQKVGFNASSIHIPVEIYEGDIDIQNALKWTNGLFDVWKKNRDEDPDLLWQYFGSQTGILRIYPASKWSITGVDLYDVRRRPWYTEGASSPKDMFILIDTSGSTHGQALTLMKHSVKSLLDTLGENDFINIAQFSDKAKIIGCFDRFVQANYRNKQVLVDYVFNLKAKGMASYAKGFEFAFEQFKEFCQFEKYESGEEGEGANCNRIIMFLTDGGTEMPEEVFKKYNWPEKKIRIFSYAVGPIANPLAAVKWIACANRGYFYKIPAMGAIRSTVQRYQNLLGSGLVGGQSKEFLWTNIYEDFWDWPVLHKPKSSNSPFETPFVETDPTPIKGLGMMTTVTLPVYNTSTDIANQTVLGVMGCDMTVSDMEAFIPDRKLGPNGYAFAINSNGYIVFHPNLKAKNGWVPSPPNVDFLEVEFNSPEKEKLRRAMLDNTTGEPGEMTITSFVHVKDEMHVDQKTRKYYYTGIPGSSISLAVVIPEYTQFYIEDNDSVTPEEGAELLEPDLAKILIAPWDYCPGVEGSENVTWKESLIDTLLTTYPECDKSLVQHLFFDAKVTATMDTYWQQQEQATYKTGSPARDGIVATFIATNGGLTRVYPANTNESFEDMKDTWKSLYYRRSFDNDMWVYSATHNTGIPDWNTTEPVVMASKAITLSGRGYKPAVVGVKISQEKLREFMLSHASVCSTESNICYLLDDGAFVMLSSDEENALQVGQFFGDIDPLLMWRLHASDVFLQKDEYDYQAACQMEQHSSAGIKSVFIPALYELLTLQWWTTKLTMMYVNFNIYKCIQLCCVLTVMAEDVSYAKNYSCVKHLAQYYFSSGDNTDEKDLIVCGNCTRWFATARLPGSNLLLVIATRDCFPAGDCNVPVLLQAPVETADPAFSEGKCNVTRYYRTRPTCFDYNEDPNTCGGGIQVAPSGAVLLSIQLAFVGVLLTRYS